VTVDEANVVELAFHELPPVIRQPRTDARVSFGPAS
jgi:hypothetical protein